MSLNFKHLSALSFFCLLSGGALLVGTAAAFAVEPEGQVLGRHDSGSLVNATRLPKEGPGYIQIFHDKNRSYWGSQGLVEIIENVAAEMASRYPDGERLQVGDLSLENGGFNGHASHQNGLDVDFAYFRRNHHEQTSDSRFLEYFDANGKATPNFDVERNWELLKSLVATGRVNRVLVSSGIKQALCDYRPDNSTETVEILRRLRQIETYSRHMHVRLTCPAESRECEKPGRVPEGRGCPNELYPPKPKKPRR